MKKHFILILLLLAFVNVSDAQTTTPTDAYIKYQDQNGQTMAVLYVQLSDTNNVAKIKIKLGSMHGANDLADYEFTFDSNSNMPAGFSFSREKNACILQAGAVTPPNTTFGEISLQNTSGVWSDTISFVSN